MKRSGPLEIRTHKIQPRPVEFQKTMKTFKYLFLFLPLSLVLSSCMTAYIKSVGGNLTPVIERTFSTDFELAWEAVLEVLKNTKMDITNKEGGFIQTKWVDNTAEKNFIDSFGDTGTYIKAQFRLKLSLTKANRAGRPTIRIKIVKEQLIQRDALEGWRATETEPIEENTLLYRIGRVILIKAKMNQAEDERSKKEINSTQL